MALEQNYSEKTGDSVEQEFQLLSILLQYPEKIDEVADVLETKHFLNPKAQIIYDILLKQFERDNQISKTKLFLKLKNENVVKRPEEMIENLTSGFNTPEELKPTIDIIKKNHQKDLLIRASKKIDKLAKQTELDISEYQSRAQEIIFTATNESSDLDKHIYTMEEALLESFEAYLNRKGKRLM